MVSTIFIWLFIIHVLFICSAQKSAIRHLNMKVNRLNRITNVLQSDVDEIMKVLSDTTIHKQDNLTNRCEDYTAQQQVNEMVLDVKEMKTEVEQLVLYAKLGLKNEKKLQHEAARNLTRLQDETIRDLTKRHLEFQNNIATEISEMKDKIIKLEDGQIQLQEENQKCQSRIENITQDYGEKINENKVGIKVSHDRFGSLADQDIALERQINEVKAETTQIQQDINKSANMFACEIGWESLDYHCYFFGSKHLTWDQAWATCQSKNSYLVEFKADHEILFVGKMAGGEIFWTGANDRNNEGIFTWQKSSQRVADKYWNSGEPNNAHGNENCATMYSHQPLFGKLNDISCTAVKAFVCEKLPDFFLA